MPATIHPIQHALLPEQTAVDPRSTHPALFVRYINAGLQEMLARVRSAENLVDDADRQQAWHLLSFALAVESAWPATHDLLLALAPQMEQAGFRLEWLSYLLEGWQRAEHCGNAQTTAEIELQIGLLYRLKNEFSTAQHWLTASIAHFAASDDHHGAARALNELAWVENLQQQHLSAREHAEKALVLVRDQSVQAMSYRVLGMIAYDQARWSEAETFHRKALVLFKRQGHKRFVAWGMQNLALALNWQGKFLAAIRLYRQAAKMLSGLQDRQHEAIVLMNLALAYQNAQQFTRALQSGTQAKTTFQALQDTLNLARVETNLGLVYYRLGMFELAIDSFRQSAQHHTEVGNKHLALNALDGLAMALIARQHYAQAIDLLHQALSELPAIAAKPNYSYLLQSMTQHLHEAETGRGIGLPLPAAATAT